MSFCGQCGARFNEPQNSTWNQGDIPTESFEEVPTTVRRRNYETETFQRNLAAPEPPKSSKKIFLLIGGILALFFLILAGIGGISALFYYKSGQTVVVNNSNTMNRNVEKSPSPNVSPEKSATPQAVFTPPTEPTKKGTFTIYANTGWQLSDIDTISQEKFTTKVVGKIDLDGIKTGVSSSGVKDEKTKSRRIYPEFPTGALLMRTRYADGKYSNVAALTANGATGQWENYPGESGRIEFCINDNALEKNGGQFTVTVNFVSAPKN